ncbi:hypothetical protein KBW81_03430 [Loktanella salsilacus]|uniref:hypothetical protein n=1 Tax=Loktanella salsilacus TaxID=195913 RepID=UPI0020B6BAD8|nr:hypothetical protein [Loktanella salsilacus]UTH48865.1 hypothetical protein KBW81_03430 [Loktanella salsilacus]
MPETETTYADTAKVTSCETQESNSFVVEDDHGHSMYVDLAPRQEVFADNLEGMLLYDGLRGTVHRSHVAKTGMLVGRTEDDGGNPRPVGFESSLERATAIAFLLHPNTVGLKCQPRKVEFLEPVHKVASNTLDFLLTQRSGAKTYVFVKNEEALGLPKTALICQAIRKVLPEGYGFATISEATLPTIMRGNNERMFLAKRFPDPEADARLALVFNDILDVDRFTVNELVQRCQPGSRLADQGRIFDAILRAIADQKIATSRLEAIDYPTVLGWHA